MCWKIQLLFIIFLVTGEHFTYSHAIINWNTPLWCLCFSDTLTSLVQLRDPSIALSIHWRNKTKCLRKNKTTNIIVAGIYFTWEMFNEYRKDEGVKNRLGWKRQVQAVNGFVDGQGWLHYKVRPLWWPFSSSPGKNKSSRKTQYSYCYSLSPWDWAMQCTTIAAFGFIPVLFET